MKITIHQCLSLHELVSHGGGDSGVMCMTHSSSGVCGLLKCARVSISFPFCARCLDFQLPRTHTAAGFHSFFFVSRKLCVAFAAEKLLFLNFFAVEFRLNRKNNSFFGCAMDIYSLWIHTAPNACIQHTRLRRADKYLCRVFDFTPKMEMISSFTFLLFIFSISLSISLFARIAHKRFAQPHQPTIIANSKSLSNNNHVCEQSVRVGGKHVSYSGTGTIQFFSSSCFAVNAHG